MKKEILLIAFMFYAIVLSAQTFRTAFDEMDNLR